MLIHQQFIRTSARISSQKLKWVICFSFHFLKIISKSAVQLANFFRYFQNRAAMSEEQCRWQMRFFSEQSLICLRSLCHKGVFTLDCYLNCSYRKISRVSQSDRSEIGSWKTASCWHNRRTRNKFPRINFHSNELLRDQVKRLKENEKNNEELRKLKSSNYRSVLFKINHAKKLSSRGVN